MTESTPRHSLLYRLLSLLTGCILAFGLQADVTVVDYLNLDDLPDTLVVDTDKVTGHIMNGEFDSALAGSAELLDRAARMNPELAARVRINHGIFHIAAGEHQAGRQFVLDGIEQLTPLVKWVDQVYVNSEMALGLSYFATQEMDEARDAIHRSQEVVHRMEGVYTVQQQDAINYLTMIALAEEDLDTADRLQLFSLMIVEHEYGDHSSELVPVLERLGSYFTARGSMLRAVDIGEIRPTHGFLGAKMCRASLTSPYLPCNPGIEKWQNAQSDSSKEASAILTERTALFNHAIDMYERSLAIREANPGLHDSSPLRTMNALAHAYSTQGKERDAVLTLRRAVDYDLTHPYGNPTERLQTLVDLGDWLQLYSEDQATDVYVRAWQLTLDQPETSATLFTKPVRLRPDSFSSVTLESTGSQEYFASMIYDVSAHGRVENIRIAESNVPGVELRKLRLELGSARFRPRIEAGRPVPTVDRKIRFSF